MVRDALRAPHHEGTYDAVGPALRPPAVTVTPAQTRDVRPAAAWYDIGIASLELSWMPAATAPSQATPATSAETDPQALGWMQGFPPPADKTITFANGSFRQFPELRWAWSNIR